MILPYRPFFLVAIHQPKNAPQSERIQGRFKADSDGETDGCISYKALFLDSIRRSSQYMYGIEMHATVCIIRLQVCLLGDRRCTK